MRYKDSEKGSPFAWQGMGYAAADQEENADRSPYFIKGESDP